MGDCRRLSKDELDRIMNDPSWLYFCADVDQEDIVFLKEGGCLEFDVNGEYSLFVSCGESE